MFRGCDRAVNSCAYSDSGGMDGEMNGEIGRPGVSSDERLSQYGQPRDRARIKLGEPARGAGCCCLRAFKYTANSSLCHNRSRLNQVASRGELSHYFDQGGTMPFMRE